jgi:hypothetical protein
VRAFLNQFGWELWRLALRPSTWLAFALSLVFEVGMSVLLKFPGVRADIAQHIWKMRVRWNEVFSGLTTSAHIMGEAFSIIGALCLALVAARIVAGEKDDGTLRMIFCRPTGRTSVLVQKCLACLIYAMALVGFIAVSSLAVGLIFEGRGNLVLLAPHEGVTGAFNFAEGVRRIIIAIPLMWLSAVSGMLWVLLFSCVGMKPNTAIVLALTLLASDHLIRTAPETAVARPYCLTTRLLSWRQVFNYDIPWPRIRRNYLQLAEIDAALLVASWAAFRRLELKQ